MAKGKDVTRTRIGVSEGAGDVTSRKQAEEALLKAGALQKAIFNSANFSSIATDAKGVIQIFNYSAEQRCLCWLAPDRWLRHQLFRGRCWRLLWRRHHQCLAAQSSAIIGHFFGLRWSPAQQPKSLRSA
jgi:PAS domain-containing protein